MNDGEVVFPSVPAGILTWTGQVAVANDSDVTVTVPAGHIWEPLIVAFQLATTATVGNRILVVQIQDSAGNTLWSGPVSASSAASGFFVYSLARGYGEVGDTGMGTRFDSNNVVTGETNSSLPKMFLVAGMKIRMADRAAIDAAADDMIYSLHYIDHPVRSV